MHSLRTMAARGARLAILALAPALFTGQALAEDCTILTYAPATPRQMPSTAVDPLNVVPVGKAYNVRIGGRYLVLREITANDAGFAVPSADGKLMWVPAPYKPTATSQADARELKLKVRELASQLIAYMDPALYGTVALPTSFVNQEDFSQSSPLGRFMAEQMIYEFNQRGYPIREYRLAKAITAREGQGEFLLTRRIAPVSAKTKNAVFVVGTYFIDGQAVFLNARLITGSGDVLRTAQVLLPNSAMTRRMLAGSGKSMKKGSLPIYDYDTTMRPQNLSPVDLGADVH